MKLDRNTGNIIWQICNGYADADHGTAGFGVTAAADGGVLVGGESGFHSDFSTLDARAIKIDANGNEEWSLLFGGSDLDVAFGGIQTNDEDFILSCNTYSTDGDVTNQHGEGDVWIVKLSADGHNHRVANNNFVSNNFSLNSFPNPFPNSTTISFTLSQSQNVSLQLFDVNGKLVSTLADNIFEEGEHQLDFNAEKINAGIYFLQVESAEFTKAEKLIVTK